MRPADTLLRTSDIVLRVMALANYVAGGIFLFLLPLSIGARSYVDARLIAKYGPPVDGGAVLTTLQMLLLVGIVAVWAVARLFRSLSAMVASVRADEAFAPATAARLRTIGWMLLVLQLGDVAGGLVAWRLSRLGVEYLDWTPSLTGWLAVLVAFILARVFATGAAMREELEGTV